jgi:hypothetical protein
MNLVTFQRRLVVAAVALTPLFNIGELAEAARGANISQITATTPIFIKILKDFAFVAIIGSGILICWQSRRIFSNTLLYLLLFVCVSGFIGSILFMPQLLLLAGLRTMLPLAALIFLWRAVDFGLQRQIAYVMLALFLLAFAIQLYQLIYFPPFWGQNPLGLNARNPGFFLIPSTMGAFACIAAVYIYCYLPRSILTRGVVFTMFPVSIMLTASAASLLSMLSFFAALAFFQVKEKAVVVGAFVVVLLAGALMLPQIVSRDDIYDSMWSRLEILELHVAESNLIASENFGTATNVGVNLINTFNLPGLSQGEDAIIADSTLISFMINFGLMAPFLFILLLLSVYSFTVEFALFLAVMSVFSMTAIITEMFPVNLLLAVNLIYLQYLRSARRMDRQPRLDAPRPGPDATPAPVA